MMIKYQSPINKIDRISKGKNKFSNNNNSNNND